MLSGCLGVVGHVFSGLNRTLDPINHILALCGYERETPREYQSAVFASVFTERHCSTQECTQISLMRLVSKTYAFGSVLLIA